MTISERPAGWLAADVEPGTDGQWPAMHGVRVLDFTRAQQGPFATLLLADMGAEVLKVEPPGGESGRASGLGPDGFSSYFEGHNRGKKSITFDLKAPGAIEAVKRIVPTCDVVVENFRPGVMERLGLGYEDLKKIRPDIIMASASAWGTRWSVGGARWLRPRGAGVERRDVRAGGGPRRRTTRPDRRLRGPDRRDAPRLRDRDGAAGPRAGRRRPARRRLADRRHGFGAVEADLRVPAKRTTERLPASPCRYLHELRVRRWRAHRDRRELTGDVGADGGRRGRRGAGRG